MLILVLSQSLSFFKVNRFIISDSRLYLKLVTKEKEIDQRQVLVLLSENDCLTTRQKQKISGFKTIKTTKLIVGEFLSLICYHWQFCH